MSNSKLSSNYHSFSRKERAALCIRALARNDEIEFQRLCKTAKREYWSSPVHLAVTTALSQTAIQYHTQQLAHALAFWFAISQTALSVIRDGTDTAKKTAEDGATTKDDAATADGSSEDVGFDCLGHMSAHLFLVHQAAWGRFCEGAGIEMSDLPADDFCQVFLDLTEDYMAKTAATEDEIAAMFKQIQNADGAPITVAGALAKWESVYAEFVDSKSPSL